MSVFRKFLPTLLVVSALQGGQPLHASLIYDEVQAILDITPQTIDPINDVFDDPFSGGLSPPATLPCFGSIYT